MCSIIVLSVFVLSDRFSVAATAGATAHVEGSCANGVCDVTSWGAKGDGHSVDTKAVRAAAQALGELPDGGVLLFPARNDGFRTTEYLTGPFNLTSNAILRVERGCTIKGNSNDTNDPWPLVDAAAVWPQMGVGSDCNPSMAECELMHQAFIFAWRVHNVSIEGGGTIDAQGSPFWKCNRNQTQFPCSGHARPHLLMISDGSDIHVSGVEVKNSPDWTLHFSSVNGLHVDGVTVKNPHNAPNVDGIDLDCVQNAVVENSYFDVGDDALCVKSGLNWNGRRYGRESANILFRNIRIGAGHGITIGSESSGGVSNVTFEAITMNGTHCGPRIKSQRGRGGTVRDIVFKKISARDLGNMMCVTLNYHGKGLMPTNQTATPVLENIVFEDIDFASGEHGGYFDGLPESPIVNVTLRDVSFPKKTTFRQCDYVTGGVCEGSTNLCPPCFSDKGIEQEYVALS